MLVLHCQKLKTQEDESSPDSASYQGSQEQPNQEETSGTLWPQLGEEDISEGDWEAEGYDSLEDNDDEGSSSDALENIAPPSPKRDLKSAKAVRVSRAVVKQLRIKWGPQNLKTKVIEAIVTPNLQASCFVVTSILHDKFRNYKWRVVQSHQAGGNGYVYVKMRHIDLIRLHAKMFEWGGERVRFCAVRNVLPINPQDPVDEYQVARIS